MVKRTKMVIATIIMALICSVALVGCSSDSKSSSGTSKESKMKIALLSSAAGANDNGYNQTAIEGLKKLKEDKGIEYKVVEATSDYPGTLKTLAEAGYNLIYSLEYDFTALIEGVGGEKPLAEQYPKTTFVVFNASPNVKEDGTVIHKNVISVMFNVNEASFLAGALSVKTNENADVLFDSTKYSFTPGDKGRKVGFIGGTKSAGIEVFNNGFAEGVNYAAKEANVNYTYYSTFDAGFSDSPKGGTIAGTYYGNGANIVYTVAGSVGDGVDAKAKEVKKLSIEVDANKDAAQPGYILTSVLKNTNVPTYELGVKLLDGTLKDEGGKVINYPLSSGATGITDLSTIEAAVKQDAAAQDKWKEIKSYMADLAAKVSNGDIKVTNAQVGDAFDMSSLSNVKQP